MPTLRSQDGERAEMVTSMASTDSNTQQCRKVTDHANAGSCEDERPTAEAIALEKHRQSVRELRGEKEDGSTDYERLMGLIKESKGAENLRPPPTSQAMKTIYKEYKETNYQRHREALLAHHHVRLRNLHISAVSPVMFLPPPLSTASFSPPPKSAPAQEQQRNSGADGLVEARGKQDEGRHHGTWTESSKQTVLEWPDCQAWAKAMKQTVVQRPKSTATPMLPQPEATIPPLQNRNANGDEPTPVRQKRKYTPRKQVDGKQNDAAPARQKRKYNKKPKDKQPMVQAQVPVDHVQQQAPYPDSVTPLPLGLQSTFQSQYQAPHFSSATSQGGTPAPEIAQANAQALQESAHPTFAVSLTSSSSSFESPSPAAASGQPESSRQGERRRLALPTSVQVVPQPFQGRFDSPNARLGGSLNHLPSYAPGYTLDSHRDIVVNRQPPFPARMPVQNTIEDQAQRPIPRSNDLFHYNTYDDRSHGSVVRHPRNMNRNANVNVHWTRHQRPTPYAPVNGHSVAEGYQNPATLAQPSMYCQNAAQGHQYPMAHPQIHTIGYNMGGGYQSPMTHVHPSTQGYNMERGYQHHQMAPAQNPTYWSTPPGGYQNPTTYTLPSMYMQSPGQEYQYQYQYQAPFPQIQDPMQFNQFQQPTANMLEFEFGQGPAFECGYGSGNEIEIGDGYGHDFGDGIGNGIGIGDSSGTEVGDGIGCGVGNGIGNGIENGDAFGIGNEHEHEHEHGHDIGDESPNAHADATQLFQELIIPPFTGTSAVDQTVQDSNIIGREERAATI